MLSHGSHVVYSVFIKYECCYIVYNNFADNGVHKKQTEHFSAESLSFYYESELWTLIAF